jgi:hypothetical protein
VCAATSSPHAAVDTQWPAVCATNAPSRWLTMPSNSSMTRRRRSGVGRQRGPRQRQRAADATRAQRDLGAYRVRRARASAADRTGSAQQTGPRVSANVGAPGCLGSWSDCARMMCSLHAQHTHTRSLIINTRERPPAAGLPPPQDCRAQLSAASTAAARSRAAARTISRCSPAPPGS